MTRHVARAWWGAVVALALVALACAWLAAQEQAATLSEVQRLRAELHQARVTLIQTQAHLANCQAQADVTRLTAERAGLEAEFGAALKPPEGAVFDWATLAFKAPVPPK